MTKLVVCIRHFCCCQSTMVLRKSTYYLNCKLNFFLFFPLKEHHFYLDDWQTSYSELGIWQTFSWKWTKQACHVEGNRSICYQWLNWSYQAKLKIVENSHHHCEFFSFQYYKDFPDEISGDISKCDFLIRMRCVNTGRPLLLSEPILSKSGIHDVTKSCLGKRFFQSLR